MERDEYRYCDTYFRRCANRVKHRIRSFIRKSVKMDSTRRLQINRLIEKGGVKMKIAIAGAGAMGCRFRVHVNKNRARGDSDRMNGQRISKLSKRMD